VRKASNSDHDEGDMGSHVVLLLQLRELAGLDQINQDIPFVLPQHGQVPSFSDPHFIADHLDFGAVGAHGAQGHLHGFLLMFDPLMRSM